MSSKRSSWRVTSAGQAPHPTVGAGPDGARGRDPSRRDFLVGTVALGAVGCLPDGRLKRDPQSVPEAISGDWPVGTPESAGLRQSAVDEVVATIFDPGAIPNIRSLLVARSGVLVAESYVAQASDRERRGPLMSATKSVSSLLAGIALDRGELSDLDVTVGDVFRSYEPRDGIADIRLRDALSMQAGIDYDNGDFSIDMEWGGIEDSVAHILGKPQTDPPGQRFRYTDACAHLAGAFVSASTGRSLSDYAREHLFSPAGIRDFGWLGHTDGRNFGAYGLALTPRDLLRLARACSLSSQGAGPVPRAWMDTSTAFVVEPDFGDGADYGYLWWVRPEEGLYCAHGHGGQFAYCAPDSDLVLAVTADPNSNEELISVKEGEVFQLMKILIDGLR